MPNAANQLCEALQIRGTGVKLCNEVGIVRLQVVESASEHVQVLHCGLNLLLKQVCPILNSIKNMVRAA